MLEALKDIAKHSIVYGSGTLLRKAIGFFMIPIYTHFLMPEDYGILEMLELFTSIFGILVFIAIRSAITRIYYEYDGTEERREVISTALLSTLVFCGVAVVLAVGFSDGISKLIFMKADYGGFVTLVLVTFYLQAIGDIGFTYLQIKQQSGLFTFLSTVKVIVQLSLNILFLVVLKQGVKGLLVGGLIASALVAVYFFVTVTAETRLRFSKKKLIQILTFGLPLVPANMATFVVNYIDRYLLNYYGSLRIVGIYSLSYKFGMLPQLLITGPFISIWIPKRLEIFRTKNAEEFYAVVSTYYFLLVCYAATAISVFSWEIIKIMADPIYIEAYRYIAMISFSYVFAGLVYQLNIGMHFMKKTKYISYINVSTAALNVILNLILIPRFHIWGAAISTLIAFAVRTVIYYIMNQKIYPIPFENQRMLKIAIGSALVYFLSTTVHFSGLAMNIAVKTMLMILLIVGLGLLRFFTEREIRALKMLFLSMKSKMCW